jgi:hypothetical protein
MSIMLEGSSGSLLLTGSLLVEILFAQRDRLSVVQAFDGWRAHERRD